jgi:uncharacterized membrane protein
MSRHQRSAVRRSDSTADRSEASFSGSATPPVGRRIVAIDALRGVAIALMIAYHFCFDLRFYRVIVADFEHDPFWLGFRALIVTSFMLLVGISLVLADRARASPAHFWKRFAVIAGCALAASAGSYLVFPRTFIYFGILHCIAVTSVLAWPLTRRPVMAAVVGLAVIAAGLTLAHPAFDQRALSWLGFTTTKPPTEDFVPLAPWAGVVFIGLALGYALARANFQPLAPLNAAPRWLQWLGRHSLVIYMVHQPVLLGLLWLAVRR